MKKQSGQPEGSGARERACSGLPVSYPTAASALAHRG